MWGDSKTTENLTQLLDEVKKYVQLEKEYITLDIVEKLSALFSAIILGFVLMCMGMVVLFYLSFTFIHFISPLVGGLATAYLLMTLILLLLTIWIYLNRTKWILNPITNFVAHLLMDSTKEQELPENKDTL